MAATDHDEPIPTRLRARSTTRFVDRYRCTNCGAPLDFADPQMYTCTDPECGDEWEPAAIADPDAVAPGSILVGDGDTATFRYRKSTATGVVSKINRRTIVVRHPDHPGVIRTVNADRIVAITFPEPESEED